MIARHTHASAGASTQIACREEKATSMIDLASLPLLKGKKALVTGIANDQSIAWGCAKAFRLLGADLAITYLNEKAKPYVEPLARSLDASILMPLDLQRRRAARGRLRDARKDWGTLDLVLHSIAFAPKEDLQGRVVDCSKEGFRTGHGAVLLVVHSHGQARGAADEPRRRPLHHDLLRLPDGGRALQHDGAGEGRARIGDALYGRRAGTEGHSGARDFAGAAQDPRGFRHHRIRSASRKGAAKAPARSLVSIDDVGIAVAFLATDAAKLITGETLYIDGGYHIID